MKLLTIAMCAALGVVFVPGGRSVPPPPAHSCMPLPSSLLGTYRRFDSHAWNLEFRADCTFKATENGAEEGGGDYTLTSGDASSGTFVFSNDRGCRQPGYQDLPTPYDYTFQHGVLMLEPKAGDLCTNSSGTEGRAKDIGDHGGWIRTIGGKLTIAAKGTKRGSFTAKGAFADKGTFTVLRSRSTRKTKTASLRLTGTGGAFTVSERIALKGKTKGKLTWDVTGRGTQGYAGMVGTGTGTAHGATQSLSGQVLN